MLVIHNEDSFAINHSKIDYIEIPINNNILLEKITNLMLNRINSKAEQKYDTIGFVNSFIKKIVELTPINYKMNIETIISEGLVSFASQSQGFIQGQNLASKILLHIT